MINYSIMQINWNNILIKTLKTKVKYLIYKNKLKMILWLVNILNSQK